MKRTESAAREMAERYVDLTGKPFDFAKDGAALESVMIQAAFSHLRSRNPWRQRELHFARKVLNEIRKAISFEALNPSYPFELCLGDKRMIGGATHRAKAILAKKIRELTPNRKDG